MTKSHFYRTIADELKARIEGGIWAVGARFPSTTELCREYEASAITVRAALKELVAAGYIESRPRSGFFVCDWQKSSQTRSDLIAFLVESVRSPFFTECIAGVEEVCREAGYHVIVSNSHANPEFEAQHLSTLSEQVAGFVIMAVNGNGNYPAYLPLLEKKLPFVFLDRYVEKLSAPVVSTDNEQGGYLAASHLADCGRRRIFALGVRDSSAQRERFRGFERALHERGISFSSGDIRRTLLQNEEAGYELTRQLLEKIDRSEPFGIFAINDSVARGSYHALKEAGLEIPRDAAVVGFDDISAVFFDPPLTSVRQDMRSMGQIAVQLLLEMIGGQEVKSVRLAPELVIRNSTDAASDFSLTDHIKGKKRQPRGTKASALVNAYASSL